ncbi:urea ABC transporter permease subunit UrtB [Priestia flexa]|uniref:Urea ABC transporter permease subunit UrtB n=1 Tax=Priestia flexa TaxID=86664 RepID=A0A8I1MGK0_9BACI|nr:urea ABC transporter permease subunit UrtB [Priestia flexa]MBN8252324.1 urea ABC transporter permease subunit UrtB [Priestia flexa]MBN8435833.1 urea ABC transporter permease subunit UrtB [Priestia flexa]MCA0968390.1 urea ABC transporter permease subunit UrtB [Priestia flexa]MCA1201779.1 urea ABC transporter permease subunit UrtB [Priestia flexa]MCG7313702.1 urea ABC transporter permease subunit UrtB [Priestia flexa]
MSIFITQLFNGLSLGSIMLLIALGLAITFGLMNVINMAHGELIMVGAYTTYVVQQIVSSYLPQQMLAYYFILAIPLAFLISAVLGIIIEKTVIRFLYDRPLDSLLATWGVSLILQQAARSIFGAPNVAVKTPDWLDGGFSILGATLPYKRLFILALAVFSIVGLSYFLYKTAVGRKMKAVMLNREMASCLGVSTKKVDSYAFALGSGFAGLAGCALTVIGPIGPSIGTNYIIDAFMIVILGGIGKLTGTVIGALGIGILSTTIEYTTSATIAKVIVFALIIAFLQWKPSGLVSMRTRSLD